jgi:hypothetical protein
MNIMRNRWRAIPQIGVKLGGGVVLVTFVVAGVLAPSEGRSEKLKNWPHKEVISPKPDVSAPEPMNKSVEISYRCGRDGRSCDLQEFMRRNMVCDILVVRGA